MQRLGSLRACLQRSSECPGRVPAATPAAALAQLWHLSGAPAGLTPRLQYSTAAEAIAARVPHDDPTGVASLRRTHIPEGLSPCSFHAAVMLAQAVARWRPAMSAIYMYALALASHTYSPQQCYRAALLRPLHRDSVQRLQLLHTVSSPALLVSAFQ